MSEINLIEEVEEVEEIEEMAESLRSFRKNSKLRGKVLEAIEMGRDSRYSNLGFNVQIFLDGEMLGCVKKIEFTEDFVSDSWTVINIERYLLSDSESLKTLISNNSKIEIRYICDEKIYAEQTAINMRKSKLTRTVDASTNLPIEKIEILTKSTKFEYMK